MDLYDMSETAMRKVAKDLVALSNEYGTDEYDNKKVKIPRSRDEAMSFIRKFSYESKGTFSIYDPDVVEEARRLVQRHGQVWVVPNTEALQYEVYVPPDRDKTTYASGTTNTSLKSGGCFIATAVYRSDTAPDVIVLRTFRDNVLLPSRIGKLFVNTYYLFSPPLAEVISSRPFLRKIVRKLLIQPIVNLCRSRMRGK